MSGRDAAGIAPCGIPCRLCGVHQRARKPCPGCHGDDAGKPKHCVTCSIKTCPSLAQSGGHFCVECAQYPCRRLKGMDARYRKGYGVSLLRNLDGVKRIGAEAFAAQEEGRWHCPACGETLSIHEDACLQCGTAFCTRLPR